MLQLALHCAERPPCRSGPPCTLSAGLCSCLMFILCLQMCAVGLASPPSRRGQHSYSLDSLQLCCPPLFAARCAEAEPLTLPTPMGEFTEELLTEVRLSKLFHL